MVFDAKKAIEFHQLAAGAFSAASDKHLLVADAHKLGKHEEARALAGEARQFGLDGALKSESAATASQAIPFEIPIKDQRPIPEPKAVVEEKFRTRPDYAPYEPHVREPVMVEEEDTRKGLYKTPRVHPDYKKK